jgi:exonuclease SbcC
LISRQLASRENIYGYFNSIDSLSGNEILLKVSSVEVIASKLMTARLAEEKSSSRKSSLVSKVKAEAEELKALRTKISNLSDAETVVRDLVSGENSLDDIKSRLLADNADVISEIFSNIHYPNEYEIDVSTSEIKLINKESRVSHNLNEVSTGQRAAFALSLFLAMNEIQNKGPKCLILDDPISHTDDINILSFLDYLRKIAIEGDRQIFFSTPSSKIANLFKHKFNFLGRDDFKVIELKR